MSDKPPQGGRDEFTREHLQKIARLIDEELPDKWGFALFAFPLGSEPGRLNYISKSNREDIKKILQIWIDQGGSLEGHR